MTASWFSTGLVKRAFTRQATWLQQQRSLWCQSSSPSHSATVQASAAAKPRIQASQAIEGARKITHLGGGRGRGLTSVVVQRGQQQQVGKSLGASLLVRRFTSNSKSPSGSSSRLKQREKALAELQQREEEALSKFFHEPSQGPVTALEGGTYSILAGAGLLIAAGSGYLLFKDLFVETLPSKVQREALERLQQDPRVMVRLGSPIKTYGSEGRNRRQRQRITHREYRQEDGTLHCQVKFQASGPNGRATVHADMCEKESTMDFSYLVVDVTHPPNSRARINLLNSPK